SCPVEGGKLDRNDPRTAIRPKHGDSCGRFILIDRINRGTEYEFTARKIVIDDGEGSSGNVDESCTGRGAHRIAQSEKDRLVAFHICVIDDSQFDILKDFAG